MTTALDRVREAHRRASVAADDDEISITWVRASDLALLVALADAVGLYRSGDDGSSEDDLWNRVRNADFALRKEQP